MEDKARFSSTCPKLCLHRDDSTTGTRITVPSQGQYSVALQSLVPPTDARISGAAGVKIFPLFSPCRHILDTDSIWRVLYDCTDFLPGEIMSRECSGNLSTSLEWKRDQDYLRWLVSGHSRHKVDLKNGSHFPRSAGIFHAEKSPEIASVGDTAAPGTQEIEDDSCLGYAVGADNARRMPSRKSNKKQSRATRRQVLKSATWKQNRGNQAPWRCL